jgi:hypothetical protein
VTLLVDVKWQRLDTVPVEIEVEAGYGCFGNTVSGADQVKSLRFSKFIYWTMFHCQFKAMVRRNKWTPKEKVTHLVTIVDGLAAKVLCSVPVEVLYRDIIGVLEGNFRDHQLGVA